MSSTERDDARRRSRAGQIAVRIASILSSLLVHGGALAAVVLWIDSRPGAIEPPTEAISIEMLETQVIEAVAESAMPEAAASPSSVQSEAGMPAPSAAASASADKVAPLQPVEQVAARELPDAGDATPQGIDVEKGNLETTEPAGTERGKAETNRAPADKTPRAEQETKRPNAAKRRHPDQRSTTESRPSKQGGAPSRASKGQSSSAGQVSASRGSAVNYAALVRARVAARKPAGSGRSGTVVVSFGISPSGALASVGLARSSGDSGLDSRVLSAVRGAGPFPAPPPGANRRFAMPFYFR